MDEMTFWEINDLIENLPYMDRSAWEQARLNAYVVAQVNSKKKLTQQDILKFKWEDMSEMFKQEDDNTPMTSEEFQRLKDLSQKLENAKWVDIDSNGIKNSI